MILTIRCCYSFEKLGNETDKPVYRTFVITKLPTDDSSWYNQLFIELRKNAVQLCYLGRGRPASVSDLRPDDYFISFFYFDSDGDMCVFDSAKEFGRLLILSAQRGQQQLKVKADVSTKPDRIMGKENAIDSTTQICTSLRRTMKGLGWSAGDGGVYNKNHQVPGRKLTDGSDDSDWESIISESVRKSKNKSDDKQNIMQNKQHNDLFPIIEPNSSIETAESMRKKGPDSFSLFTRNNCHVNVVKSNDANVTEVKKTSGGNKYFFSTSPTLRNVLPSYGNRKVKRNSDNSITTEPVSNSKNDMTKKNIVLPYTHLDAHYPTQNIGKDNNSNNMNRRNINMSNEDHFSVSEISGEYLVAGGALDFLQYETMLQNDDNFSTQVQWQDLDHNDDHYTRRTI